MGAAKVHKSLRIEPEAAERVTALREEGESEAAAYARVIAAGLQALERPGESAEGTEAADTTAEAFRALRGQLEAKDRQIAAKDAQIAALTDLAQQAQTTALQAQTLHAMAEKKALQGAGEPGEDDAEDAGADAEGDGKQERIYPNSTFPRFLKTLFRGKR